MPLIASPLADSQEGFTLLLYGPSGVGKTSLAVGFTHPELKPAVVFNTDKGLSSVLNPDRNTGITQISADVVSDFLPIMKMTKLQDTHPQKPEWLRGVRTFIWDSMTSFVDESVMENAASPDSDTKSPYQAGQRDYLISQGQALSLFDNLKRQGYNQIVVAGTSDKENKHGFALPPGLTERIIYRFSYVLRVLVYTAPDTGITSHILATRPTNQKEVIKVRNTKFRKRIDDESAKRLKAAGWKQTPGNAGFLLLSDPLDPNPPSYQVSLDDIFQWYLEEVLDK